ncbi:MAG TPA: rod shape-determining protein MreC [Candidatus Pacearchaeota archaeon]|nr:rod shape-determining protein MreC [Candidatus Pacearchaeota archaeon]
MKTFTLKRIIFLLIFVFTFILILSFFKDDLKNGIQKNFLGLKQFFWEINTNKEKSCSYLEAQNDSKIAELDSLKKENEFLREIIGISINEDYKLEIGNVTGKNSFEDVITIDKGLRHGVKDGMAILTGEKALIGKILKAYDDYSEVLLISSKQSLIDIKIASYDEYAIAKGDDEKIFLDHLEKNTEVKEGDICITSSLGGQYKEGILVGKIVKTNDLASEVFKTGEIKPFFNIKDLDKVLIIKDDK